MMMMTTLIKLYKRVCLYDERNPRREENCFGFPCGHFFTFYLWKRKKKKKEPIILDREELDFLCEGYHFFYNNKILLRSEKNQNRT